MPLNRGSTLINLLETWKREKKASIDKERKSDERITERMALYNPDTGLHEIMLLQKKNSLVIPSNSKMLLLLPNKIVVQWGYFWSKKARI